MSIITNSEGRSFHIIVNKASEGGYSGQCLELPGAISEGETEEELKINMREAIQLVLESIEERARANNERIIEIPLQQK
jgi:predicted RNase H-like HicB family nuclease